MAQQTIGIGTTANDGTGDPLRSAFDKSNDNFTELYGKPDLSLATNTLTLTKADGTTDTVDLAPYLDDTAITSASIDGAGVVTFTNSDTSTFTLDLSSLLDDTNLVTSVNTQVGAVVLDSDDISEGSTNLYNQTHTGDVTGSTALTIANDVVDHDNLDGRYTAVQDISTTSGTINLDASSYAAFNLTGNLTTATLNVQNIKTGQAIDILLSGTLTSAVLTLADDFTTSAINKVGSNDLDTSGTNLIQLLCVDDTDSDAILTWAVATYTTDTSA